MVSVPEPRWEQEGYGEITAVESSFGTLAVTFANRDSVELQIADLGLPNDTEFRVDEESGALIAMPPGAEEREIDWMLIRRVDDPEFADVVRERDADESRRIGRRLRALRENQGLSQKAAAEMAGMSAPQLAKIERGESDLRVSTVRAVLRALGASFAEIAGPDAPEVSMKALSRYARKAGAPAKLVEQIATKAVPATMAALLEHGFAWRSESLAEGTPKALPLAFAVSFKARDSKRAKSSPLVRLARTVSEASAGAFEGALPALPEDPAAIRDQVVQQAGDVTLSGLAEWAWRAGIVVVPMSGAGSSFSGAAWLIQERPVVVLNTSRTNVVSWLFDLAHEIGHQARRHPSERDVVDVDDPGKTEDEQEREANEFARALLVPDSDRLLEEIRELCAGHALQWQKEKFKWKAIEVAQRAGVNEAMLLTIAAYALTEIAEPIDRWGSAENHAALEGPARPRLQQSFADHISTESMSEMDAALVEAVVFE